MSDSRPIGVFDSGLGGLTVVREIEKRIPCESIIYFGDTGRVPYGTRSCETIKKYALQDEKFLLSNDVKLIIAACGTVSSVACDTKNDLPVPFFEVVSHSALEAVRTTKNKKIGVIGTSATIKSGKHAEIIKANLPDAQITAVSCPVFVPLVEEGWYSEDDIIVIETVKRYLKPIIDSECDTLILGCTHYPILENAIKSVLGDGVSLINAGVATADAVADFLMNNGLNNISPKSKNKYFVSDKADSFKNQASILLGEEIEDSQVTQVDVGSL